MNLEAQLLATLTIPPNKPISVLAEELFMAAGQTFERSASIREIDINAANISQVIKCALQLFTKATPALTPELRADLLGNNLGRLLGGARGFLEPKQNLSELLSSVGLVPKSIQPTPPETGRLYVQIRKHPNGMKQPIGTRRVFRIQERNGEVLIGIGRDGKVGWRVKPDLPAPSFLTFRLNTENGPKVSLDEAIAYWKRHDTGIAW